ncbi:hypothetical protein GN956_G25937 [Arapaima gigas]
MAALAGHHLTRTKVKRSVSTADTDSDKRAVTEVPPALTLHVALAAWRSTDRRQLRLRRAAMFVPVLVSCADKVGVDVNDISNDPVKEEQEEQPVARKKWGAEKSQKESREAPGDEADDHVSGEMKNMNSASVKEEQEDQPVAKKKRGAGKSQERRDAPSDEEDNKG